MFNIIVAKMGAHVQSLMEFPPTQAPTSLSIEKLVEQSLRRDPTAN